MIINLRVAGAGQALCSGCVQLGQEGRCCWLGGCDARQVRNDAMPLTGPSLICGGLGEWHNSCMQVWVTSVAWLCIPCLWTLGDNVPRATKMGFQGEHAVSGNRAFGKSDLLSLQLCCQGTSREGGAAAAGAAMSSSAAASSYWRVAGMSYLKYSNLCADMVRSSLKEPQRTKAKLREAIYYRAAVWKDGKPEKQGADKGILPHSLQACM